MEELNSKMIINKKNFVEINEITQNLYNIIGRKKILNPEILEEIGKLSNIIYNENKNEEKTIMYEFPFPIGTYLKKKKSSRDFFDQLKEYIIRQDGIYALLILNSLSDTPKNSEIPLEKLLSEWTIANEKEIKHEEGIQKILKK